MQEQKIYGRREGQVGHLVFNNPAKLNAVSLDIRGSATHPHTVELTAAAVGMIGSRQTVSKTSSNDEGHRHTVTFN